MDSLWRYIEYMINGLVVLLGQGIGLLGSKVAESALPAGRPIDKIHNARRMKKEMAELRRLSARLSKYSDQAEETCRDLCRRVVFGVLNPNPDEPLSQVVEAAQKLCLDILCYEQYFPLFVFNKRQQMSISELWDLLEAARAQLEFYELRIDTLMAEIV